MHKIFPIKGDECKKVCPTDIATCHYNAAIDKEGTKKEKYKSECKCHNYGRYKAKKGGKCFDARRTITLIIVINIKST